MGHFPDGWNIPAYPTEIFKEALTCKSNFISSSGTMVVLLAWNSICSPLHDEASNSKARDTGARKAQGGKNLERASSEARSAHTSVFQYSNIQSFLSSLNKK